MPSWTGTGGLSRMIRFYKGQPLIRVPDREGLVLSDLELLRRYAVLYPEPTRISLEGLRQEMLPAINDPLVAFALFE